jgi:hypothetical protein
MARRRKVWIIVTQDGDLGEGPWDDKRDAENYLYNEVGVVAGLLQVYEDSVDDLRRVRGLSFDIQEEPEKFKGHL